HRFKLASDVRRVEVLCDPFASYCAAMLERVAILEELGGGVREFVWRAVGGDDVCAAGGLQFGPGVCAAGGEDGGAAGEGLKVDETEIFLAGGKDEEVGGLIEGRLEFAGDHAEEVDGLGEPEARGGVAE